MYAGFKDSVLSADFADMGSLSSKKRGVKYLLCVIDVFTKYSWLKPLEDKKAKTVFYGLIEIASESKPKLNKLGVDQGREFYNNFM